MAEVKSVLPQANPHYAPDGLGHPGSSGYSGELTPAERH
jgi:hypothetical protein